MASILDSEPNLFMNQQHPSKKGFPNSVEPLNISHFHNKESQAGPLKSICPRCIPAQESQSDLSQPVDLEYPLHHTLDMVCHGYSLCKMEQAGGRLDILCEAKRERRMCLGGNTKRLGRRQQSKKGR